MRNEKSSILITGGAGFIGSNFIKYFLKRSRHVQIINLDKLTYAGNLQNLEGLKGSPNYKFVQGDICDDDLVNSIFKENNISGVINFAAESHVDNSIGAPESFIRTNINGTFVLLEAAKKKWFKSPKTPVAGFENARFQHISTDEVYGSLGDDGYFDEGTPYAPNSPYSASKAASDFLVRSYHHTYGMNTVISNCSNNFGPNQHDEKLIPTIIRNALAQKPIPIYGAGKNVRDWLYVEDHCIAIEKIFKDGQKGHTYVIGARNEYNNLAIAHEVCSLLDEKAPLKEGSYSSLISFVEDRPGHDYRYAIDATKIFETLGWKPKFDFLEGMNATIDYYLEKYAINS